MNSPTVHKVNTLFGKVVAWKSWWRLKITSKQEPLEHIVPSQAAQIPPVETNSHSLTVRKFFLAAIPSTGGKQVQSQNSPTIFRSFWQIKPQLQEQKPKRFNRSSAHVSPAPKTPTPVQIITSAIKRNLNKHKKCSAAHNLHKDHIRW